VLVIVHNIVRSWRKGAPAGNDPWDARTLEWSIPSPPPEYNFLTIPTVYDRDDWWAQKRRQVRRGVPVGGGSYEAEAHSVHLPQPSYWPLVVAIGLLVFGFGMVYNPVVIAIGLVIAAIAIYAWSFEPVNEPDEHSAH